MTAEQVTVQRALLEQVLYHIVTGSPEWDIDVLVDTLRTALDAPVEEPVAVVGRDFQLLWARLNWSKGLKVGDLLYTAPQARQPACAADG